MDLSDLSTVGGTLPASNSVAVAASLFVFAEGARTRSNLVGSDRFSSPYGGELMGATYTGVLAVLASGITKSPLPLVAGLAAIVFFAVLYHWQENAVSRVHKVME